MRVLRITVFSVLGLAVGCGGDGRSLTAPPLPQPIGQAPCSEYDSGSDGTIDDVYTFTYDADGFEIQSDGVNNGTAVTTYGRDHFYLSYTLTVPGDSAPSYEEHLTRDDEGRVLTYQSVFNGQASSQTNTYDELGRRVHVTDVAEDGSTTETVLEYAGDDLIPTTVRITNAQGSSVAAYTSSDNERVVHIDIDDGEDGTVDRTRDLTYDDERRATEAIDRTGTQVTSRQAFTYTDRGQLASQVYADSEGPPDDYVYTVAYDGRGWWTGTDLASPSGDFASAVYRETPKEECVLPGSTVARRAPHRPTIRRPAVDPGMPLVVLPVHR